MAERERPEDESRAVEGPQGFLDHYVRGLRTSTRHNAAAYGFSVATSASFGVLDHVEGGPTILDVFVYVVGASIAFALVNTVSTRCYRTRLPDEPAVVVMLGTAFSVFSISASVGVATGVAYAIPGWPAWLVGAFAFACVYVLVVGLEVGLAARQHELGGRDAGP